MNIMKGQLNWMIGKGMALIENINNEVNYEENTFKKN